MTAAPDWPAWWAQEQQQAYFVALQQRLAQAEAAGQVLYPPAAQRLRAFALTPFAAVKVVILGQDPYHGPGQAEGLAFSVPVGQSVPPSLRNIYKALERDVPDFCPPEHGHLGAWAQQGVLLLNTVFSVAAGQAASHAGWGWERFSDAVLQHLNAEKSGLVFMLWGAHAQKKAALLDARKHLLLHAPHPSPLSAHRGFFTCGHFSQANAHLQQQGLAPIDWRLPPHKPAVGCTNQPTASAAGAGGQKPLDFA